MILSSVRGASVLSRLYEELVESLFVVALAVVVDLLRALILLLMLLITGLLVCMSGWIKGMEQIRSVSLLK